MRAVGEVDTVSERSRGRELMSYGSIEDPATLRRIIEASLLMEADLELPDLLRHIVEEACSMTGARYGAIGILNAERNALAEFLTVGLEPDVEERIGDPPSGNGILGLLLADPRPLRLADLGSHPEHRGFPPGHPPMSSFLGVPVKVRNEVYGLLYLTDKGASSEFTSSEFTSEDQSVVEALALGGGIAIENVRLHQRAKEAAVYEDRDRLARDLHDTVIQRLFAVGLRLQSLAGSAAAAGLAERLDSAVSEVDQMIRHIRSTIYELGSDDHQGVRAGILSLVHELEAVVDMVVEVSFDGPVDAAVSDRVAVQLLAAIREALTDVGGHAEATRAAVSVSVNHGLCRLEVLDDGRGVHHKDLGEAGLGLVELQRRAEELHGTLTIENPGTGGTLLTWEVPVNR
jgi:signal transduction histidine kinase